MKQETAFTLIGQHLDWTDADFAKEFRELQLMIDHKYDSYQGFQPGTRFHVALLNWLSQFPRRDDKKVAYRFIKDRLVYVSQREMHHLVSLMMPIVERLARGRVARELGMPLYCTYQNEDATRRFDQLMRRTLYVGLSDGARMDVFRRYNEGKVSNEQVVAFSEITESKWKSLRNKLAKSLIKQGFTEDDAINSATFEAVCLIDDFSGSGASLIRLDDEKNWDGKIPKFCAANEGWIGEFLSKDCVIYVHHHLASERASRQVSEDLGKFSTANSQFDFEASFSHILPAEIVIDDQCAATDLTDLIKAHYNQKIEDEHTKNDIWYGYKQCGLPLVLEHNTPNNSVALLWAESLPEDGDPRMKPLFIRRKRHSSHG